MEVDEDYFFTKRPRMNKASGVRPSKLADTGFIATDRRDYKPKILSRAELPWDFSQENINPKD